MKRFQKILVDAGYDLGAYGPNKDGIDGAPGDKTFKAATAYAKKLYKARKFKWHKKDLIWLRMSDDFTDKFSDYCLTICWGKVVRISNATTKPGKYWVTNPVRVGGITGTGIQLEGQIIGSHKYHAKPKSKWGDAGWIEQIKNIFIARDGNKDNILDREIITVAPRWYGFFMHAMGRGNRIWNWSAGCLGLPLAQWQVNVDPYFEDGDIINDNIILIS